ncbi:hypothetical protein CO057_02300 [Candidatus Uhrbacteria bacterium CG_4_9_14_0_2_um_filter_41_50]|uniref:Uncharacterized protein n=1 Tax=Candidatus Uhrbacteria bacterium CG_4_9_14_0_2_um_filter_41_50 TaxID=1975031 RepID=A0A2M8EPB5_9BACT|nr:MAG: hypothetical protein COZ45_03100 [Candidatus Uhrbacteria bacterium CG_4_10_14_3_um_filter_41_21]PIZ55449.1 MAG: hypothetical protein COY24_00265 [Candidatus Uhrbacteria bacterium CG_4_10_14_0_2_um_filter_41_21]PJB84630.1 MAG: hypothetical protein CO086_02620 [Candidatus Uhrbacteria bacterium CG_4_9_14_0_8_um_filter_41_16]PJC24541.1 MAG: hypothetical protein CO057_02300 [Candidatus Uhrbacteria bacterium CG_4_9_14_0_2_um_filter_41_50]PJE75390.1 MAG: hypothetical protein COV03_00450 [Candi
MNMISKISLGLVAVALTVPTLMMPMQFASAQPDISTDLDTTNSAAGFSTSTDLPTVIGQLIQAVLGVLGIVLLVLMIYSGFLWMTAGGDAEQVKKAKTIMINSVVGLIILLAAYAISAYVITILGTAGLSA